MTLSWDVVIPARNAEATIGEAVASALDQEPRPRQVVVCSDGSTDATAAVARAAGAQVVEMSENRGVGAARQALLERVGAPWFLVLDADDRLLPTAGALLSRAVAAAPEAWVIGFGELPDDGGALAAPTQLTTRRSIDLRTLWLRNRYVSSSTLIRREAAVRVGGFAPVRRLVDYVFWFAVATHPDAPGRLERYGTPLTARAVNAGTITGDVVTAVRSEHGLLLEHADAALAGLPAVLRAALVRGRLAVLWWRGLSRHVDYGRTVSTYLPPEEVVPGAVLPALLRWTSRRSVQRALRSAAAGVGPAALGPARVYGEGLRP